MNDSEKRDYNPLNTTEQSDDSVTANTVDSSTDRGSMASSRLQDYINKRKQLDQKTVKEEGESPEMTTSDAKMSTTAVEEPTPAQSS